MNNTDLSWITAKQKRLITWDKFARDEIKDPAIRKNTLEHIEKLSAVLLKIWEANNYTEEDKQTIEDLERKLEQINEEARLRTASV